MTLRSGPLALLLLAVACGNRNLEPNATIDSFGLDPQSMVCASVSVDVGGNPQVAREIYCVPLAAGARTPTYVTRDHRDLDVRVVGVEGRTLLLAAHGIPFTDDDRDDLVAELHLLTQADGGGWSSRCVYAKQDRLRRELRPIKALQDGRTVGVMVYARDAVAGEESWHPEHRLDLGTGGLTGVTLGDLPGTWSVPETLWRRADGADLVAAIRATDSFSLASIDSAGRVERGFTVNVPPDPLSNSAPYPGPIDLFSRGGELWWLRRETGKASPVIGRTDPAFLGPREAGYVVHGRFRPVGPVLGAPSLLWSYDIGDDGVFITRFLVLDSAGHVVNSLPAPRPARASFRLRAARLPEGDVLVGPGSAPEFGRVESGRLYLHAGVDGASTSVLLLDKALATLSSDVPAVELGACP